MLLQRMAHGGHRDGVAQFIAVDAHFAGHSEDVFGGHGESFTAGLNWYWNPNARMQFNYINGNITNHADVNGSTAGNYQIIGTRFMVDF